MTGKEFSTNRNNNMKLTENSLDIRWRYTTNTKNIHNDIYMVITNI